MDKAAIQTIITSVDTANPGLRISNRYLWTEKIATECWKVDKTVGQKRADMGRPVSDDTIGWIKPGEGTALSGTPGQAIKTPMTAVDLINGSTGEIHFNEIPLKTDLQYFVIPPASGASSAPSGPVYPPYPGDKAFDPLGAALFADFAEAGEDPNVRMSCWYGRTIYDWLCAVVPDLESSIVKHRGEWRTELGLPPVKA